MGPISKDGTSPVIRADGKRFIVIPDEFFLEGDSVYIRQDRDGAITVHPADENAREALYERFNPFVEWPNEMWPKTVPPSDEG